MAALEDDPPGKPQINPGKPRCKEMPARLFRNAYNRMIEARKREAAHYLQDAMVKLDDRTLEALGTTRQEVRHNSRFTF